MAQRQGFAFAVVDMSGRQSASWRVVVHGDDIYLIQSELRDECKISLHADGRCQFSHLDSYWAPLGRPNADRHISRWQLPGESIPGLTIALRIVLPGSDLPPALKNVPRSVDVRIPAPDPNGCAQVFLTLRDPVLVESMELVPGQSPLWSAQLACGDVLELSSVCHNLSPEHLAVLAQVRAGAPAPDVPLDGPPRCVVTSVQQDGGMCIFDLAL